MNLIFKSTDNDFKLFQGDCMTVIPQLEEKVDMVFADPPYFLSNGGISVQNGKKVCVDKGDWDKRGSEEDVDNFNYDWIKACSERLKDNGTIWISGTYHNIFSVGNQLTKLGFKILNMVTWVKKDPPPNLSCRMFTYSSEFIIWAKKTKRSYQTFNYEMMKKINNGNQMTDVWMLPAVQKWEKSCGKHPTQKPLVLLARIILASTKPDDLILDPFCGSGTTGIAANLLGRRFVGIEREQNFLNLSKARREEIQSDQTFDIYNRNIIDQQNEVEITSSDKWQKKNVLVARVGSPEQFSFIKQSLLYNLPLSKVGSLEKIVNAEYVLLFLYRHPDKFALFRLSKQVQKQVTKEELKQMACNFPDETGHCYEPHRDKEYLLLRLKTCDTNKLYGKKLFHKPLLINKSEEKAVFLLKSLETVLEAFE